jgi:hypothetical protein
VVALSRFPRNFGARTDVSAAWKARRDCGAKGILNLKRIASAR